VPSDTLGAFSAPETPPLGVFVPIRGGPRVTDVR
jgi:hypothetical protein